VRVQALLDDAGGRYALIGGAAVMAYGNRARTRDLDFVVLMALDDVASRAEAQGLEVERKSEWHLRLWDAGRTVFADILDANVPLLEEAVRRAVPVVVGQVSLKMAPPEVLVALKVIAGRPRDLRDIEDVLEETAVDVDEVQRLLAPFDLELPRR
jgi:hypothetical protein